MLTAVYEKTADYFDKALSKIRDEIASRYSLNDLEDVFATRAWQ